MIFAIAHPCLLKSYNLCLTYILYICMKHCAIEIFSKSHLLMISPSFYYTFYLLKKYQQNDRKKDMPLFYRPGSFGTNQSKVCVCTSVNSNSVPWSVISSIINQATINNLIPQHVIKSWCELISWVPRDHISGKLPHQNLLISQEISFIDYLSTF